MGHAGHVIWILLNWPNGIVVGNLIASVIWASVFEWRLRRHHRKIHALIHGKTGTSERTAANGN